MSNLRANVVLIGLSLLICCVAYPLGLRVFGRIVFPDKSDGSLLTAGGPDGRERVIGSSQIAQAFTGDEYFWPRPSAVSYNAAAAGGSNWGANNPKLRDRVAQQLGPMIRYRKGSPSAGTRPEPRTPQQDIAAWAGVQPPAVGEHFDRWLQDPANHSKVADLEPVPADMVTASGAGLDPHITLRNALSVYQLDRVAKKRTPPGGDWLNTRKGIEDAVKRKSFTPLLGLVGESLVNVLELNVELDKLFPAPAAPKATGAADAERRPARPGGFRACFMVPPEPRTILS
jgi:K+-transporting ATPase c subunit